MAEGVEHELKQRDVMLRYCSKHGGRTFCSWAPGPFMFMATLVASGCIEALYKDCA